MFSKQIFKTEKRKDYVNDNITRASDKYKQKVKDDFHVSYFEQSKQTDYIADVVRHSNFKEQCEFYNKELAQYGIEFVYIEP